MKKEIQASLIAIVAIAAIAIFVVNPSMSTSFEIDDKLTSDEMELLFLGSADDEYQEDKYVSEKFEKRRISASAGGAEVYEAGLLPEFLEKLIDKLFEFLSGTNTKELGEDLYERVDEEYPHYGEVGEPGSTPVAGEVIGEYVGPKELIIDGELSDDEQSMFEAMGVGEIVFGRGRSTYDVNGVTVPGAKSTRLAFIKGRGLYFHQEDYPEIVNARPDMLGSLKFRDSKTECPRVTCNFQTKKCYFTKEDEDRFTGNHLREFDIVGVQSGNETEYVVDGLSPEFIEENIGNEIRIRSLGGEVRLKTSDIKEVEIEVS
jgi:hypothetical protein